MAVIHFSGYTAECEHTVLLRYYSVRGKSHNPVTLLVFSFPFPVKLQLLFITLHAFIQPADPVVLSCITPELLLIKSPGGPTLSRPFHNFLNCSSDFWEDGRVVSISETASQTFGIQTREYSNVRKRKRKEASCPAQEGSEARTEGDSKEGDFSDGEGGGRQRFLPESQLTMWERRLTSTDPG